MERKIILKKNKWKNGVYKLYVAGLVFGIESRCKNSKQEKNYSKFEKYLAYETGKVEIYSSDAITTDIPITLYFLSRRDFGLPIADLIMYTMQGRLIDAKKEA